MKTSTKLFLRRSLENKGVLMGIIFTVSIATVIFTTLFSIGMKYEESSKQFMEEHNFAPYIENGIYDEEKVGTEARLVLDFADDELYTRVITMTSEYNNLYIHEGSLPNSNDEVAILQRNSELTKYKLGSKISINNKNYTITALVSSPEYIYMYKNDLEYFVGAENFIVAFKLDEKIGYNQLLTDDKNFVSGNVFEYENSIIDEFIKDDIKQIKLFAEIFSPMFVILSLVVIAAMITRSIKREYKLIGIIKSLGYDDYVVVLYFVVQFILAILLGTIIGGIVSFPLFNILVQEFKMMFYVPTLQFEFYPQLYLIVAGSTIIFTVLISIVALRKVLKYNPAQILKPVVKNPKRVIKISKLFFWKYLSFNTRYTIRGILRLKSIYISSVIVIACALALIFSSLGFVNSITMSKNIVESNFGNDIYIPSAVYQSSNLNLDVKGYATDFKLNIDGYEYNVQVNSDFHPITKRYEKSLSTGVVVTQMYSEQLNLNVNDTIKINGTELMISRVVNEPQSKIYGTFEQFEDLEKSM